MLMALSDTHDINLKLNGTFSGKNGHKTPIQAFISKWYTTSFT